MPGRRLDPKTMRIYHIDYDTPDDPDIKKRLKRVPDFDRLGCLTKSGAKY